MIESMIAAFGVVVGVITGDYLVSALAIAAAAYLKIGDNMEGKS
jgi:hypothetical protein